LSLPSVRMKQFMRTLVISEYEYDNPKKYSKKITVFNNLYLFSKDKEKVRYLCHHLIPLSLNTLINTFQTSSTFSIKMPIHFFQDNKLKKFITILMRDLYV
jgi:hypothetical protein